MGGAYTYFQILTVPSTLHMFYGALCVTFHSLKRLFQSGQQGILMGTSSCDQAWGPESEL